MNDIELSLECERILNSFAFLGLGHYNDVFVLLHDFGFRVNELYRYQFWTIDNNGFVNFPTSKGSGSRVVHYTLLPDDVYNTVVSGELSFYLAGYQAVLRAFYRAAGVKFRNGGKNITTHIFRHNYIKKLSREGVSIDDIMTKTGIKSKSVVNGYINSRIFVSSV